MLTDLKGALPGKREYKLLKLQVVDSICAGNSMEKGNVKSGNRRKYT
jgi:hypothetical protein